MINHLQKNRLGVAAVGAAIAFAVVGCGGSDGGSATTAPAGTDSANTTEATTAGTTASSTEGTDGGSGSGADGAKIAYLSASSANTWLASSLEQMQKVAADKGIEIVEFDAQFDPTAQSSQFQDVLAQGGYQGIILVSLNGAASAPDIQSAADAGIPVVVLNQVVGDDFQTADPQVPGVDASIMSPPYQNGKRLGELTVKACEGVDPCKVGYIYGIKGIPIDEALRQGFSDVTADHPNITIAAEGEGKYLGPEEGINATQDMLQVAPDLNVIVGSDQSIQGSETALTDEGKLADVKLIGLGGSEPAIAGVKDGKWFGDVFGAPADEGRVAMETMIDILNGGKTGIGYDPLVDAPDNGLVTKDNVDQFTPQWAG